MVSNTAKSIHEMQGFRGPVRISHKAVALEYLILRGPATVSTMMQRVRVAQPSLSAALTSLHRIGVVNAHKPANKRTVYSLAIGGLSRIPRDWSYLSRSETKRDQMLRIGAFQFAAEVGKLAAVDPPAEPTPPSTITITLGGEELVLPYAYADDMYRQLALALGR